MRALLRGRELACSPSISIARSPTSSISAGADLGRHHVTVDTDFAPLPIVHGDQAHLQQVVLNLILNGADAMDDVPARGGGSRSGRRGPRRGGSKLRLPIPGPA